MRAHAALDDQELELRQLAERSVEDVAARGRQQADLEVTDVARDFEDSEQRFGRFGLFLCMSAVPLPPDVPQRRHAR